MKTLQMYFQCWVEVTRKKRYQDKWLTDETFFRAIKAQFPSLDSLDFNRGLLNKAISKCCGPVLDDFTESNQSGRFRRQAKGLDPYGNPRRTIWGYFITTPGGLVARPGEGKRSFLSLLMDETINNHYSVARGVPTVVDLTTEIQEVASAKRKAKAHIEAEDDRKKHKQHAPPGPESAKLVEESYWQSPEAKKLFLGSTSDNRDVVKVLEERIDRLQSANRTDDGWKDLIAKHDKDLLCSQYDIFMIRQRCSILCLAYTFALEEMNSARWIEDCCVQAIFESSRVGIDAATNERTVAGWNILLRSNREHFPHPNNKIHKAKKPLPDLLEYFQDEISSPWHQYCIEHLADLTIEMARNQLISKIIPEAVVRSNSESVDSTNSSEAAPAPADTEDKEESKDNEEEKQEEQQRLERRRTVKDCLLKHYTTSPISLSTAWRWIRRLGFSYDNRKKTFFVDGHERPNVVFHRNQFCKEYLAKLEPRCHRWIQVTKETVEGWRREKKKSEFNENAKGYTYRSENGVEMIEFHVDDHDFLHGLAIEMGYGLYGGNLSVRRPPGSKPLMLFGQDESVFNQFLLGNRQWVGPAGQRALLPKTDGLGIMLSAFQSRETGFGLNLSATQLSEINETRRGKSYVDADAAIAINGQAMKKDLLNSPFVIYFELGANNEGYWTYNHMSIQFEDCVDCLKVVYPHFDFAFLFDHSQGHAKKLSNGLDAYNMNKNYGGVQPKMRESMIKESDGYLGMNPRTLNVGDIQSFIFKSTDDGPFWMSQAERQLNRHDRVLPPPPGPLRMRNKTISELRSDLGHLNILSHRRNYRLTELQEFARTHGIEAKTVRTREKKGWENQPKGLMQVLWERGWIDESQLDKYTMETATDANGEALEAGSEDWNLKHLMAGCLDFAEELTALQHVGSQLGVNVIITPKFHAELAGEGVEYSWGVAKGTYRRKPLDSKKGKESFKRLVDEVTSRDILTIETIRKLSRRARAYVCAYFALFESKNKGNGDVKLTLPLIERLVKAFKTHRAAIDFDSAFVNGFVPSMKDGVIVIE